MNNIEILKRNYAINRVDNKKIAKWKCKTIIKSGSYRVLTGALINKKPFIRAFVWDNRYEINKEFLSRKKAKSDAEEEFLRLKKLDEEIEKKKKEYE